MLDNLQKEWNVYLEKKLSATGITYLTLKKNPHRSLLQLKSKCMNLEILKGSQNIKRILVSQQAITTFTGVNCICSSKVCVLNYRFSTWSAFPFGYMDMKAGNASEIKTGVCILLKSNRYLKQQNYGKQRWTCWLNNQKLFRRVEGNL